MECGVCCQIATYQVHIPDIGCHIPIYNGALAVILVAMLFVLIFKLNSTYRVSYDRHQRILHQSLESRRVQDTDKKAALPVLNPFFYTYTQFVCFLFIVEAIAYFPAANEIVHGVQIGIYALCAFFDNFMLLYLARQEEGGAWSSALVAALIGLGYVLFVVLSPPVSDCAWCGVHFPVPTIVFPYLANLTLFLVVFALSRHPVGPLRPRPASGKWAVMVAFAYGSSSLGLVLLEYAKVDFGYCFLSIALLEYTLLYAPVLFIIARDDTRHCRQREILGAMAVSDVKIPLLDQSDFAADLQSFLDNTHIRFIHHDELEIGHPLATGGAGSVHKATWQGTTVAVKKLSMNCVEGGIGSTKEFLSEVQTLASLKHPHIITLFGACVDSGHQAIVTEFMPQGSLFDYLHRRKGEPLCWETRIKILVHTASGMQYLHHLNPALLHRDLKSQNILLDNNLNAKVCDFGLSHRNNITTGTMGTIGTTQWAAPEVLRSEMYTEKADVYSFGVVVWELVTGKAPFAGMNAMKVAVDVAFNELSLEIPPSCPPAIADLLRSCLASDPINRPSFEELVRVLPDLPALPEEFGIPSSPTPTLARIKPAASPAVTTMKPTPITQTPSPTTNATATTGLPSSSTTKTTTTDTAPPTSTTATPPSTTAARVSPPRTPTPASHGAGHPPTINSPTQPGLTSFEEGSP